MNIRPLIKEDCTPFNPQELEKISNQLNQFQEKERREFRDENRKAVAENKSEKLLIVSGPGTGKTLLFLDRIKYWFITHPDAKVFVTSFVRKLVEDLDDRIKKDKKLTDEQRKRITVSTLHTLARSIVEKNRGTSEWPFKTYFKIIAGKSWEELIWGDVLAYYPNLNKNGTYLWENFREQLYNNEFKQSKEWKQLKHKYFELCKFYNAAGFADLIIRARIALEENNKLNENNIFVIDEYQDFNLAEEDLIQQLLKNSRGILIVGDDDQVLYEKLKCGRATLIRELYKNKNIAKAMLPFCSRSNYHITKVVAHFIQQFNDIERIEKIFLPLELKQDVPKVKIIACAAPSSAVDYIEKFIKDYKNQIVERKTKLESGEVKDAFLLILTPTKGIAFYDKNGEKVHQLIADYKVETREYSEEYYKVLNYYSLANHPKDNFLFRKVLFYEGCTSEQVHELLVKASQGNIDFCDLSEEEIKMILDLCEHIKSIIDDTQNSIDEKIKSLQKYISINDRNFLKKDLEYRDIKKDELESIEEKDGDLKEIRRMNAIEIITIVGSKGLSADHVIILGFDDINMKKITKNAFYVAMARPRKSLHIVTSLKSRGSNKAHDYLDQLPEENLEFYKHAKRSGTESLNNKGDFCKYLSYICDRQRGR